MEEKKETMAVTAAERELIEAIRNYKQIFPRRLPATALGGARAF